MIQLQKGRGLGNVMGLCKSEAARHMGSIIPDRGLAWAVLAVNDRAFDSLD